MHVSNETNEHITIQLYYYNTNDNSKESYYKASFRVSILFLNKHTKNQITLYL